MHVASKVFLGMIVVASLAGIWLTSKLFKARGVWLERVAQKQEQVEGIEEDLRKKRLVVAEARSEVNRIMTLWGRSWNGVQGNQVVNAEQGAVRVNVGGNAGVGKREFDLQSQAPNLYLFAQAPQGGGTKYLGEFRITSLEGAQTLAQLTRPPYAGEAQQWPPGVWRVRESVPSSWRGQFTDLREQTVEALQDVQDQNARLVKTDELNAKSQEQLQRRLAQLDGNPDALPGSSQEVVDGLVASLRLSETARDVDLGRLDELRHEYDRKYRQLMALIEQNRQLEDQLPGAGAPPTPAGAERQAVGSPQSFTR